MMLKVFIGYDSRQPVAYHVAAHSVVTRASQPVSVIRLQLNQLPLTRRGLTEFTYSRFLAPYLSAFRGTSLFLDADTLCLGDVYEIAHLAHDGPAVSVVMHAEAFERPSVMLFNNIRCRMLTPEYVQHPANPLFDLSWGQPIGELPPEWNHLVGYSAPAPNRKLVHFTKGVPIWPETRECEYGEQWHEELRHLMSTVSFHALMGQSVHVKAHKAG